MAHKAILAGKKASAILEHFPGRTGQDVRNMLTQARYAHEGRCMCGGPMPKGNYPYAHCEECRDKSRQQQEHARTNGLCGRCGQPANASLTRCYSCQERMKPAPTPPSTREDLAWSGFVRWLSAGAMKSLVERLPFEESWTVVDLFGGSGAIAVAALHRGYKRVVYADIHPTLCDIVQVVKGGCSEQLVRFSEDLSEMPPTEFQELYAKREDFPIVGRAALLATLANSVVNRNMHKRVVPKVKPLRPAYHSRVRKITPLMTRLEVENLDFVKTIEKYDGPKTVFVVDPPFPLSDLYEHNLSNDRFIELVDILMNIEGRFILFPGATRFAAACCVASPFAGWRKGWPSGHKQLLVSNFDLPGLLPADLFRYGLKEPRFEAAIAKGGITPTVGSENPRNGV